MKVNNPGSVLVQWQLPYPALRPLLLPTKSRLVAVVVPIYEGSVGFSVAVITT